MERIKQIIKTDYFLKGGQHLDYATLHQKQYFYTNMLAKNDQKCLREELFLPSDGRAILSNDITTTPSGKPLHILFNKSKGFWKLRVVRSSVNDLTDFTISVLVGNKWRFYPPAIKRHIVNEFDQETYSQWRETVMNDIDNLKALIQSAKFAGYAYSAVCDDSSERLCKLAGLVVRNKIAFLLPQDRYSKLDCQAGF